MQDDPHFKCCLGRKRCFAQKHKKNSSFNLFFVALGLSLVRHFLGMGYHGASVVCIKSNISTYNPCLFAQSRVDFHHGQPLKRAHLITARCLFSAADVHVSAFHGQPFMRAHLSTWRCPPSAAILHVISSHGQPSARNTFNASSCSLLAVAAQSNS